MHDEDLLTTAQAAAKFGVSRRTVLRWVVAGDLAPAHRLPGPTGAVLFDRRVVESFQSALTSGAAS